MIFFFWLRVEIFILWLYFIVNAFMTETRPSDISSCLTRVLLQHVWRKLRILWPIFVFIILHFFPTLFGWLLNGADHHSNNTAVRVFSPVYFFRSDDYGTSTPRLFCLSCEDESENNITVHAYIYILHVLYFQL